jgi:hypothetical protein
MLIKAATRFLNRRNGTEVQRKAAFMREYAEAPEELRIKAWKQAVRIPLSD